MSWFIFTVGKKGGGKNNAICSYSIPGEQAWGMRSSLNTCGNTWYLSYTQDSRHTKCFCVGNMSSNELVKNYRYAPIMIDRVYLHTWFPVQHTLCIDMNLHHLYKHSSVQYTNEYQVACEMVSLELVPQVLQHHEGSWISIFCLGTSMLETCDSVDIITHL